MDSRTLDNEVIYFKYIRPQHCEASVSTACFGWNVYTAAVWKRKVIEMTGTENKTKTAAAGRNRSSSIRYGRIRMFFDWLLRFWLHSIRMIMIKIISNGIASTTQAKQAALHNITCQPISLYCTGLGGTRTRTSGTPRAGAV